MCAKLSLDDAIRHIFTLAKEHENRSKLAKKSHDHYTELEECGKANECRQLAEWLILLKHYETLPNIIAETKASFHSDNQDYYTGYICALSLVEGLIATLMEDTE